MKKYPGEENEVSKRARPVKIPLTMDPKYRGIGASTKVGDVKTDIVDSATGKFYGSKAITGKIVEDKKMKLLKSLSENAEEAQKPAKVIWAMDKEDPTNPEVLVQGVGRYKLKSLKANVRAKFKDLYEGIAKADDADAWSKAAWKLDHAAMREMVKTINAAEIELQATNTANVPNQPNAPVPYDRTEGLNLSGLFQTINEANGHDWDMGKMIKGAKDAHANRAMKDIIDSIISRANKKEISKKEATKLLSNKELSDAEMKQALSRINEAEGKEQVSKVTLVINTTNDAFNVPEEEIARILTKAAHDAKKLENKSLLDTNGNKVGTMTFTFSRG